jgi:uncharacterized protein YceH (UPF0502 family)
VLGVLIEKALTTPGQYPLTLNALVNGCNQLSNRDPVLKLDEGSVLDALDGLRKKGLARELFLEGSRVAKYRHTSKDALGVEGPAAAVLAELLLRGPQSAGGLRQNASRMHPVETLEALGEVVAALRARTGPDGSNAALVQSLPPPAGSRAELFMHTLCPSLLELVARAPAPVARAQEATKVDRLERALRALAERIGPEAAAEVDRMLEQPGG